MQQRYCLCGAGIRVRYFFTSSFWLAFFYRSEDDSDISACPCCGRALDIEQLR